MVATLVTVLVTAYLTSGDTNPEAAKPQSDKSRTRSILRKTTPAGKHLSKKTSFAQLPVGAQQQPQSVPEEAGSQLEVPPANCAKFLRKSPPPSPNTGSDIDLDDDDLECNNLLLNAKKARSEVASKSSQQEKLTESELQEEKRIQSEQLAQIYSVLSQNEETLGNMSYDDLKDQASMYQSS